jgi:hypothetical protein
MRVAVLLRRAGSLLAVGLLLLGAAGACGGSDGNGPDGLGCKLPAVQSAPAGGGDASALKVVEQGFSQVGPEPSDVSMGAVVENTGTQVAYRVRVTFQALDAQGGDAIAPGSRAFLVQEVPIIRPSDRAAVGISLSARSEDPVVKPSVTAAKISVAATATSWLPPGDAGAPFAGITTKVTPGKAARANDGSTKIDYQVTSGYCGELVSRGVSVVFRDASGAVVGGFLANNPTPTGCAVGTSTQQVSAGDKSVPEKADLDRTEVTQYCDLSKAAVAPPDTAPSGAPVN